MELTACAMSCEVHSRIVGYYRPLNRWNEGKQEEYRERKVFKEPQLTNLLVIVNEGQRASALKP